MSVSIDQNSYLPEYNSFNMFGNYKLSFIFLLIGIIIVFIFIFSMFNKSSVDNEGSKPSIVILEVILWITLVVIILLNAKWLHDTHFSFTTEISNIFNDKINQIDIRANTPESHVESSNSNSKCVSDLSGEVFNIPNNTYTYSDAADICKSLNSRLATYDEVESAYRKGANWCSYGWSDDQMALFPIQKSVYNDLKNIVGHEHDCGRPGINGGYISDKKSKFGVNCYGKKPNMTDNDKDFMDSYSYSPAISDSTYNSADKVNDILIAPFNKSKWNLD